MEVNRIFKAIKAAFARKWRVEVDVDVNASPEQIWKLCSDPLTWDRWNDEMEWIKIDGPFVDGMKGRYKIKKHALIHHFQCLYVEKNVGYAYKIYQLGKIFSTINMIVHFRFFSLSNTMSKIKIQLEFQEKRLPMRRWLLSGYIAKKLSQKAQKLPFIIEQLSQRKAE